MPRDRDRSSDDSRRNLLGRDARSRCARTETRREASDFSTRDGRAIAVAPLLHGITVDVPPVRSTRRQIMQIAHGTSAPLGAIARCLVLALAVASLGCRTG